MPACILACIHALLHTRFHAQNGHWVGVAQGGAGAATRRQAVLVFCLYSPRHHLTGFCVPQNATYLGVWREV
jgi:hypothetical protein